MYRALAAVRPAAAAARSSLRSSAVPRTFATSARRLSDEHHGPTPPQLYGPGAKTEAKIPSDIEQATGIERFQLLGKMEGIDVFDMQPLDSSRLGTLQDPIKVVTYHPERLIGCTGAPADSHEVVWLAADISKDKHRCPECGSVYALDFQGEALEHAHH